MTFILALIALWHALWFNPQMFPFPGNLPFSSGGPTITQVGTTQTAHASGSNPATTTGINTTGATMLAVTMTNGNTCAASTLVDSNSNTWHNLLGSSGGIPGGADTCIWYAYDKAGAALVVGASHTVTGTGNYTTVAFTAWSGTTAGHVDPFDVQNNTGSTASGACPCIVQPGSTGTLAGSGELVITTVGTNGGTSMTISSPFTATGVQDYSGGANYGNAMGYYVAPSTAALNPTWTEASGTTGMGATIVAFK